MGLVERSRTLRPTTRKPESPYKIDSDPVGPGDVLQLTLYDESCPGEVLGVFVFLGSELVDRASFHFNATRIEGNWEIRFSGAKPVAVKFG